MCNIDQNAQMQLLAMGMNLIGQAMEATSRANPNVLEAATVAYSQGKITKSQFMAVIDALDESTYHTRAYSEPSWNKEYLDAHNYLNQYRR